MLHRVFLEGVRGASALASTATCKAVAQRWDLVAMLLKARPPAATEREPHNGYLILQGGLPETEAFIASHWK